MMIYRFNIEVFLLVHQTILYSVSNNTGSSYAIVYYDTSVRRTRLTHVC